MAAEREVFRPTPHPVLRLPTRAEAMALGEERLREFLAARELKIRLEREDAFQHGYEPECWRDADRLLEESLLLCVFGGNGAGKTFYMARTGVRRMVEKPGARVLWLHESEKSSILVHQSAVWHYLPKELREVTSRRDRVRAITYTVKSGFADNRFVMPNGSIGVFGTYKQDIGDYEGTGWDLICADENLPLQWLKTLLIRLPRCGGKFVWGFTPIHGITPAIRHVVDGAATEVSRPAPLLAADKVHVEGCPPGHMPYVQRPVWDGWRVVYFFSEMNPYGGYGDLVRVLKRMSQTDIERRAYGWARNTLRAIFPQFGAVHVVAPEAVPSEGVTRRHIADPAGARNMFQIWVATDSRGRHFVYREWPDVAGFGEWAVPSEDASRWDGAMGPGQPALGYGVADYKRIILEAEGNKLENGEWVMCGEEIYERLVDPRSGAAQAVAAEQGGTSFMDLMLEEQRDRDGRLVGPSMQFDPAQGLSEDQGIMCINDLLAYDAGQKLCAGINEPRLFVSSDCANVIWALQNYTRHDGEKAACKDPVDCLRYFATGDPSHVTPEAMGSTGGGAY